jgi:hypothetical protein
VPYHIFRFIIVVACSVNLLAAQDASDFTSEPTDFDSLDIEALAAVYDQVGWSDGNVSTFGDLIGFREQDKWGLISLTGKILVKPTFYRLKPFDDQYLKASVKGSFSNLLFHGLLDKSGKVVLSCSYFDISRIANAMIVSSYQAGEIRKGLLDLEFNPIAPVVYQSFEAVGSGVFAARLPSGKWHFFNLTGEQSLVGYDDFIMSDDHMIVKRNGQYGLMDVKDLCMKTDLIYKRIDRNKQLVPFPTWEIADLSLSRAGEYQADSLSLLGDVYISHLNGNQQIIIEGNHLFAEQEVQLKYASKDYLITKDLFSQKWQLVFTSSNQVINGQDSIKFDGMYFSTLNNGQWNVYNRFGRKLSLKNFEETGKTVVNLLPVKRLGFWTLMDFQGNLLTNPRYDSIHGGESNRIAVNYLGSFGVLNAFGDWVLKPMFDDLEILGEVIFARRQDRYFVFDLDGVQQFSIPCDELQVRERFIAIRQGNYWGILNRSGEYLADPIYDEVGAVGVFLYGKTDAYVSLFYEDGQQVTDANTGITSVIDQRDDLYKVEIDQKIGYVDAAARLRIANRYDDGGLLSEDRLAVKLIGRWGYVDRDEQLVIQPIYEEASDFEGGIAIVKRSGLYGLIDRDGAEVLACEYSKILHRPGYGYIFRSRDERWGATDAEGQVILSPYYHGISETSNGLLLVNRQGNWGIIDEKGYTRLPFEYASIQQIGEQLLMKKLPE